MRTFGVEEELILVDGDSGAAVPAAPTILAHRRPGEGTLAGEMHQEMLEVISRPCSTADDLASAIARGRRDADTAARAVGARAVALATSPLPLEPHHSPTARYAEMMRRYGATAQRSLTCGFHVHVSLESAEEGVAVLDRIREWLPVILALTGNSPFCDGIDTGYSSFRSETWNRWAASGPNPVFGTVEAYRRHEAQLLATGTLIDAGMLYFDARLSRNHPTVELRIADVCLREEDAVVVASLCRALVETAAAAWRAGEPPAGTDQRMLRLATWQAALSGVHGRLVDPVAASSCSPLTAVTSLLRAVEPALADAGDRDRVVDGVHAIIGRGNGATLQREWFSRRKRLSDVVLTALESSS